MDWLSSISTELIGKDLDGLWARQQAISDNIANFETPGYKTKTVSFEDQLKAQIASGGSESEVMRGIEDVQPAVAADEGETLRADGNSVDLDQQSLELARTTLNYYYSLQEISDAFSRLKTAIGGN